MTDQEPVFSQPVTCEEWRALADRKLRVARDSREAGNLTEALEQLIFCLEYEFKAVIARQRRFNAPPERKEFPAFFTHDLTKLARLANLHDSLQASLRTDRELYLSWKMVTSRNVNVRYSSGIVDMETLEEFFQATENTKYGIRAWLRKQ